MDHFKSRFLCFFQTVLLKLAFRNLILGFCAIGSPAQRNNGLKIRHRLIAFPIHVIRFSDNHTGDDLIIGTNALLAKQLFRIIARRLTHCCNSNWQRSNPRIASILFSCEVAKSFSLA